MTISSLLAAGCLGAPGKPGTPGRPGTPGTPADTTAPAWHELFDGTTLAGLTSTNFGGEGEVHVENGALWFDYGNPMTGVTITDDVPHGAYELEVVAARMEGTDFFCGLTFPVGDRHLTLVLGGWGGSVCGLSNLDGSDASGNDTRTLYGFDEGRDYRVTVRVTRYSVRVLLDEKPFLTTDLAGRDLSLRPEVELCRPLGLCSFSTRARIRTLRWRPLADS